MEVSFNGVMIYAKNRNKTAQFYIKYFGFEDVSQPNDSMIELVPTGGGARIIIHQAGKAVKMGQVCVKLVFYVSNVEKFKVESLKMGLKFGTTHEAEGYSYANVKDPSKNNVQISSRPL